MRLDYIPQHVRRDENGHLNLDDRYLMAYRHFDGFTSRLLSIVLLIDKNFELSIYHVCSELGPYRAKAKDDFHYNISVKEIPSEVFPFLEKVVANEVVALKDSYGYEGIVICDNPEQSYLFATNGQTKSVSINGMLRLTEGHFNAPIEREFLKFHIFIKGWTDAIYQGYIQNYPG